MRFPGPVRAKEFFDQKMTFTTGPVELNRMLKDENINVVDVRAADDFAKGHVPGAVNLSQEKWDAAQGLKKDKINVLYCYTSRVTWQRMPRWSLRAEISSHGNGRRVRGLEGHELDVER